MKFNEEQQIFIDALINKRVAQVRTAAEAKAAETVATAPAPTELKRLLAEAHDRLRLAGIRVAAAELGAISAEQVATLLDSSVMVDTTGSLYVTNSEGQRRFLPDGKSMPVARLVSEFLELNPHLVRPSGNTGAGSRRPDAFWGIFQNK